MWTFIVPIVLSSPQQILMREDFPERRWDLLQSRPSSKEELGLQVAALQSLLGKLGYLSTAGRVQINNLLSRKTAIDWSDYVSNEALTNGILRFQALNGLPRTGVFDEPTKQRLLRRTCGVPDYPFGYWDQSTAKMGSIPPDDTTWKGKTDLTYIVYLPANYDPSLITAIERAAASWSSACTLLIRRVAVDPEAEVQFLDKHHMTQEGEACKLTLSTSERAHAFFPKEPTHEVHFGTMNGWANGGSSDMESFALHEFGHLIGLQHSMTEGNVMFFEVSKNRTLSGNDKSRANKLYPVVP